MADTPKPQDASRPEVTDEDVAALRQLSVFGALNEEAIRFLASRCEDVTVPAGRAFCEQGSSGHCLFVLRSGRVAVQRSIEGERVRLAELEPGACFGEVAMLSISPRTASVEALEDCTAMRLSRRAIFDLSGRDLEQFALFQMNLAREVGRRLAVADEALGKFLGSRADGRR